ncbi:MAG: ABC transporter ATP-binding protein [Pirellulaceae bacterium]|nr:ABC transporter ATP-binding protein [Pirellulaceae bacterium]
MKAPPMAEPLLSVENLQVQFRTDDGLVEAVRDVSFQLAAGQTLGIVGESGSGKSVTNLAVMGLVPQPPGRIVGGQVRYRGRDLLRLSQRELSRIRGNRIAMIFQDPMTALNPFLTVAEQMTEVTERHLGHSYRQALARSVELLERVGIPAAAERIHDYPHQFSGGMRQRVMIAMALLCQPEILIADEPTTALDVTIQAQILELLKQLQREEGTAIILISHDLGVVASLCQSVLVMYGGKVVERAESETLFANPRHPYTLGLLRSIPRWDGRSEQRLMAIPGQPPNLARLPSGCSFHPRCPYVLERCRRECPPLEPSGHGGDKACFVDVDTVHDTVPTREVSP